MHTPRRINVSFDLFDTNRSGDLDVEEVVGAVAALGMSKSKAEALALIQKYGLTKNGVMATTLLAPEFATMVDDLMNGKVEAEVMKSDLNVQIDSVFHLSDSDKSGDLDAVEVAGALKILNLEKSEDEFTVLMAKFGQGGTTLQIEQFRKLVHAMVESPDSAATPRSIQAAGLNSKIETIFQLCDSDDSGDIDATELTGALRLLGYKMDSTAATEKISQAAAKKADGSTASRLGKDEFKALALELLALPEMIPMTPRSKASADNQKHYNVAFALADNDNTGDLDPDEVPVALRIAGIELDQHTVDLAALIDKMGTLNAKGVKTIDGPTFSTLVSEILSAPAPVPQTPRTAGKSDMDARIRTAFKLISETGSLEGELDAFEVVSALRSGLNLSNPETDRDVEVPRLAPEIARHRGARGGDAYSLNFDEFKQLCYALHKHTA